VRGVLSGVTWFRERSSPAETDRWIQNEGTFEKGLEGRGGRRANRDATSRHAQVGEHNRTGALGPGETRVFLVARCLVPSTVF
jgi:hypothetical protein